MNKKLIKREAHKLAAEQLLHMKVDDIWAMWPCDAQAILEKIYAIAERLKPRKEI